MLGAFHPVEPGLRPNKELELTKPLRVLAAQFQDVRLRVMTPLREYAEHWFAHTALRSGRPHWLKLSEQWITDIESARPGFAAEVRQVALEALGSSQRDLIHRALTALAVVGTKDDLTAIESLLTSPDSHISGAASTARFEIVHRAA